MNEGKTEERVAHSNIYSALSAFQGELKPIETIEVDFPTKSGARINFSYSPLGKIMEAIHPLLSKHGLSVRHETTKDGVECILSHESYKAEKVMTGVERTTDKETGDTSEVEHYSTVVENELRSGIIPATKTGDMKDVGSAITYARRYSLTMLLGISSEEDKDVQLEESSKKKVEEYAMKTSREHIEKASGNDLDKQIVFLQKELRLIIALEQATKDERAELMKAKKTPSLGLKREQYEELLAFAMVRKQSEEPKHAPEDMPAVEGDEVEVGDK